MSNIKKLKQFVFNGLLLENTFVALEQEGITVKSGTKIQPVTRFEETDFSPKIRYNANKMASIYTAFFCLENAVRELITDRLVERKMGYKAKFKTINELKGNYSA
ncbi:MAG: hypothetical protein U0586_04440 [Candidatus Brocadiaceae bacterium]